LQQPWRWFALTLWVLACPLRAQETPLAAFEQMEILYFNRATIDLSPLGKQKLERLMQAKDKEGVWAIGIPQNHGASEQVIQGRIRVIVSALLEQGIVGVQTLRLPPVNRDAFDPMVLGRLRGAGAPLPEEDPNADEMAAQPAAKAVPRQKIPAASPVVTPAPPPGPSRVAGPLRTAWGLSLASRTYAVQTPSTTRIEATPYQVLGVDGALASGTFQLEAAYAKTFRNAFSVKEQADPARNLDVSDAATSAYERAELSLGFKGSAVPIQVSFGEDRQSVAAVLPLGALVLDQAGDGWVSIVDGVRYAYRTRVQSIGLDWWFGDDRTAARTYALGAYTHRTEKPFSVREYGPFENQILYQASYRTVGLHGRIQGDPFREGLHLDDLELKVGRASGLSLVDKYHLLGAGVADRGFQEASLRVAPRYLAALSRGVFLRITLDLEYVSTGSAKLDVVGGAGQRQLMGLYGNRFAGGLKVALGFRN